MKIGVVTFHRAVNYGAALQAWALRSVLCSMGHEVSFIDYDYVFERKERGTWWVGINPRRILGKIKRELFERAFCTFQKSHLGVVGRPSDNVDHLSSRYTELDLVICGSDQVWNPEYIGVDSDEQVSWLAFLPDRIPKVSYAASFGVRELPESVVSRWSDYARKFLAISVREKEGQELVSVLGRNDAVHVPDPTLLHTATAYKEIEAPLKIKNSNYLFSFRLAEPIVDEISDRFCADRQWEKVRVGAHYVKWFLQGGIDGPSGWLSALKNSKFVITDSFHCLVFCLLYHKDFVLVPRTGSYAGKNVRVLNLLEATGLLHRVATSADDANALLLKNEMIDWGDVECRLMELQKKGIDFIVNTLNGVSKR